MTRYGEEYKLNTEEMENIATYMNDEIWGEFVKILFVDFLN